ncbi:MAG: hypothetical protein IPI49_31055 [Myxococcales bacterium]|nr:hypothetical protein [Myxococcales bacterium]
MAHSKISTSPSGGVGEEKAMVALELLVCAGGAESICVSGAARVLMPR